MATGGMAGGMMPHASFFGLVCSGQIESAYFPEFDNLYCKFSFLHGPDWSVLSGLEEGISQFARGKQAATFTDGGQLIKPCVWNFPVDIAFKSTNPFGWPQLLVTVYGLDALGRDVIRGYGTVRLPVSPGQHTLYMPMFVPIATSPFHQTLSWLVAVHQSFWIQSLPARAVAEKVCSCRHASIDHPCNADSLGPLPVTRVRSQGTVKIQLSIITKDLELFGYRSLRQSNTANK
ncbi:B9 domain-containing protein [Entophlyctis helioformis]|nr:B9 domain-containing protein [Entophlyctis helioformis]